MADTIKTPLGKMIVREIYDYYDRPILYACISRSGQNYLTIWIDSDEKGDKWFFVPISEDRFTSIRGGYISIRDAIINCEDGWLWEIWQFEDGKSTVSQILARNVIEDDLPDKESIIKIQSGSLPSLEQPIEISAYRALRDVLDIAIEENETHDQEIDANILGQVLVGIQSLTNSISLDKERSSKGRIPEEIIRKNKLKVTGLFAASFGIRLQAASSPDIFGETDTSKNIYKVIELFNHSSRRELLKKHFNSINLKAKKDYKDLLKVLYDNKLGARFKCASPNEKVAECRLSTDIIKNALNIISEEPINESNQFEIIGDLVGADTSSNKFHIKASEEDYSGYFGKELKGKVFEVPTKNIRAVIEEITEINTFNETKTTYVLHALKTN